MPSSIKVVKLINSCFIFSAKLKKRLSDAFKNCPLRNLFWTNPTSIAHASMWIQIQIRKQQWNEWESYIDSFGFNIIYTSSIYYTRTSLYTFTHTHTPTGRTYVWGLPNFRALSTTSTCIICQLWFSRLSI